MEGSPWRVVRGVVRRVVRGVVRRVVRGAGSVGSPRIGGQSFLLSRFRSDQSDHNDKRSMGQCFVPDCNHTQESHTCKFFRFPKNSLERKRWIRQIR